MFFQLVYFFLVFINHILFNVPLANLKHKNVVCRFSLKRSGQLILYLYCLNNRNYFLISLNYLMYTATNFCNISSLSLKKTIGLASEHNGVVFRLETI